MLHPVDYILAASGESELTKVIIGAVFFLIWVISSIASAISKKKEQEKRLRARDAIQNAGVSVPPPLPGSAGPQAAKRAMQRAPMTRQPVRQPTRVQKPPQPQRRFAAKAPRPLPAKPSPRIAPATVATTTTAPAQTAGSATEITATVGVPRRTASATATTLHSWLRPMTLRQQFMLTEVLQPPLALREHREL